MDGKRIRRGLVASAALVFLAACGRGGGADKAGGEAGPVTLRLGTMESQGAPYGPQIEEFARQVASASGGSVRIEVVWDAAVEYFGEFGPDADQKVAGLVQDGKLDMALIPARAWDELGVTSLQALQAPFLVSDLGLVDQVVQSPTARDMLAGLDEADVVGLALLPEGLRHPVGFQHALLTVQDFAGVQIRALPSKASYTLLEALGATPVDVDGEDFSTGVSSGDIAGAESGFAWGGSLPEPGTMTANVTFFPKVNALVVGAKAFDRLSEEQRSALYSAADETTSYAVRTRPRRPSEQRSTAAWVGRSRSLPRRM
jgi:TRAP-type C4-dicarboxylate transport system substrate-binding protein